MANEKNIKNKTSDGKVDLNLEGIPFVGSLFKGIEKLVNLAEKVEQAGGEIKRTGEIKGLGDKKAVYGFSVGTCIGGRPKVQTFGNIRPIEKKGKIEVEIAEEREPIVDVFNEKDHILIIAELPGITQDCVKLDIKGDILILEANAEKRKYAKEILLPAKVDFAGREVSFKNGILEVKIKK
ncbi:MAG: Hsp20/alpha crystallin family protein [bacterium]